MEGVKRAVTLRSASEFVQLRESTTESDYRRAATETAPLGVWQEIIRDYPEMRFWVAQNKTVPLEVLRVLAGDEDPRVRSMVASKRKLDQETLAKLARDSDEAVRAAVARNPKTTPDVLAMLKDDPWDAVRWIVENRTS